MNMATSFRTSDKEHDYKPGGLETRSEGHQSPSTLEPRSSGVATDLGCVVAGNGRGSANVHAISGNVIGTSATRKSLTPGLHPLLLLTKIGNSAETVVSALGSIISLFKLCEATF